MEKPLTIKEIAILADVSVSTVSRVINHKPSVNPEKRERVERVIDENGFQPSMVARSMVSKKTNTIAIVVSDITNPYFTSLIAQIESSSRDHHYSLLLFNTMTAGHQQVVNPAQEEIKAFDVIQEKKADGVIVLGGEIDRENPNSDYLQALNHLNKQIPTVVIGLKSDDCDALFIQRNEFLATQTITQHLLAIGYRQIGFIGGEPGIKITTQRLNAFKQTMSIYADFDESLISLGDYYIQDGYESMKKLLEQGQPLDAIVAINDRAARGAIRAAKDKGLEVPNDIAVGSSDAFPDGEWNIPRLTTIDQHNEILGNIAIKQLIHLINHEGLENLEIHAPELIIRESCGTKLNHEKRKLQ